jgi:hypothetical protein
MLAAPIISAAQIQKNETIERFTGNSVNVTGAPSGLRIDVLRWSTDQEREKMVSTFATKGQKDFVASFKDVPTIGYIWTSEAAGYVVKYAHRETLASGEERIVLAAEKPLGSWNMYTWKPAGALKSPAEYEFTLLELRLSADKPGEGKGSVLAKVAADAQAKTLGIENYADAPTVLKDVKRMNSGYLQSSISGN